MKPPRNACGATRTEPVERDLPCSHNLTKPGPAPGHRECQLCGHILTEVTGK